MSAVAAVAGLGAALTTGLLLAPTGWLTRVRVARHRPLVPVRPGERRAPLGPPARAHHRLATALESVGRVPRARLGRVPDRHADRRWGQALLASGAVSVLVSPVLAPVVLGGVWAASVLRHRSQRVRRERAVRGALPDAVDLFRLAVGAGLSVHQAVDAVAPRAPAPIDATLSEVRRRVGVGVRLGDALDVLDDLGDPVLPLAAALRGAARYGTPLGPSLERVGADARVLRRRRAEEEARRLPVQLLFPLVVCVLPAFGLLAVVPLLLASLGSLSL